MLPIIRFGPGLLEERQSGDISPPCFLSSNPNPSKLAMQKSKPLVQLATPTQGQPPALQDLTAVVQARLSSPFQEHGDLVSTLSSHYTSPNTGRSHEMSQLSLTSHAPQKFNQHPPTHLVLLANSYIQITCKMPPSYFPAFIFTSAFDG
jgi:hypothetical protein